MARPNFRLRYQSPRRTDGGPKPLRNDVVFRRYASNYTGLNSASHPTPNSRLPSARVNLRRQVHFVGRMFDFITLLLLPIGLMARFDEYYGIVTPGGTRGTREI